MNSAAWRPERDSQRGRVYKAEQQLDSPVTLPTMDDLGQYLKRVLNSKRVWAHFPFLSPKTGARRLPIEIKDGRGCVFARGGETQLVMPKWARSELIFLHEIAHMIHRREKDSPEHAKIDPSWRTRKGYFAGHGWRYCMIYLQLVRLFLGKADYDMLRHKFKEGRVRYRPPRVMSPEQRAAAVERLAKMRVNAEYFRRAA